MICFRIGSEVDSGVVLVLSAKASYFSPQHGVGPDLEAWVNEDAQGVRDQVLTQLVDLIVHGGSA